jgi:hypothetical protein
MLRGLATDGVFDLANHHRHAWPAWSLALLPALILAFCCLQRSCFLPMMPIPISLGSHFRSHISVLCVIDGDASEKAAWRLISDQS